MGVVVVVVGVVVVGAVVVVDVDVVVGVVVVLAISEKMLNVNTLQTMVRQTKTLSGDRIRWGRF